MPIVDLSNSFNPVEEFVASGVAVDYLFGDFGLQCSETGGGERRDELVVVIGACDDDACNKDENQVFHIPLKISENR